MIFKPGSFTFLINCFEYTVITKNLQKLIIYDLENKELKDQVVCGSDVKVVNQLSHVN